MQVEHPRQTVLTKLEFRSRFSLSEKVGIEQARDTDPIVRVLMTDLELAEDINLEDGRIVEGLGYMVQQDLITTSRMQEILS